MAKRVLDLLIALSSLKNQEEVTNLVADLLTKSEVEMLATRLRVAKRLLENKTLNQVVGELNTGKNTVAKVAHWLESRGEGFRKVVARLPREKEIRRSDEPLYSDLKRRYPSYFALYDILNSLFEEQNPDTRPAERVLADLSQKKTAAKEIDRAHRQA